MRLLWAFFTGMREFRNVYSTAMPFSLLEAYEAGHTWAHRLTLRRYES